MVRDERWRRSTVLTAPARCNQMITECCGSLRPTNRPASGLSILDRSAVIGFVPRRSCSFCDVRDRSDAAVVLTSDFFGPQDSARYLRMLSNAAIAGALASSSPQNLK